MNSKKLLAVLFLFATVICYSQSNFSYTPEKPKPGDVITISYEAAGDIANAVKPIEGFVYQFIGNNTKLDDVNFERKGKKYIAKVETNKEVNFLFFSFSSDKKFDNNDNKGYYIQFYDADKVVKNGNYSKFLFHQYYAVDVGVEKDEALSLASIKKELEQYPENKEKYLSTYLQLSIANNAQEGNKLVQTEIESLLKKGLKEESDYAALENIFRIAKLPQQGKFITDLKKEKYPNGKWVMAETLNKFYGEKDLALKKEMLIGILKNIETDANWIDYKENVKYYNQNLVAAYITAKDFDGFRKVIVDLKIDDKSSLSSIYNNAAWEMQKKDDNLEFAEEISAFAVQYAKEELNNPLTKRPDYYSAKQWEKNKAASYGRYADTYAMVLYKLGKYKQGFPYAKESAITIKKGEVAENNITYALLAEKVLSPKKYIPELEKFVKEGKSGGDITDILKRAFIKKNKSEAGFDKYIVALQEESRLKMLAELRKAMLNEKSPSFALLDLDGKNINIADLKGKVVVVDFWATWCGPCIASFPGMQKAITQFKDDPTVKFIFIDTWESSDNKEKAAKDFIDKNKYTFQVLMDNEDKVVAQFKVDGIPTKFVIDKEGNIRFKSVGFSGSDDKIVSEITAMIELATEPAKKTF